MDPAEIHRLASVFRTAIEQCDKQRLGLAFEQFPRGACSPTSLILAEFLRHHGARDIRYASGLRWRDHDPQTHAWLKVHGQIVDITADQFSDGPAPVTVTTDTAWHATFLEDEHPPWAGDFRRWDDCTAHEMATIFAIIDGELAACGQPRFRRPADAERAAQADQEAHARQ